MRSSLYEPGEGSVTQFHGDQVLPRRERSCLVTTNLNEDRLDEASQSEAIHASVAVPPEWLRIVHTNIATATAHLPITMEMAWTLPQLLKRIHLVSPDTLSTSGALRTLIRRPELDLQFERALAESGFLSCDQAIGRARWKYDIAEMAKQSHDAEFEVLEHCRAVLSRHRMKQPFDWEAVLNELKTLSSWFPELRTIQLLERLYARLHALHVQSVLVAQCWLDWRVGPVPNASASTLLPARTAVSKPVASSPRQALKFQAEHHA